MAREFSATPIWVWVKTKPGIGPQAVWSRFLLRATQLGLPYFGPTAICYLASVALCARLCLPYATHVFAYATDVEVVFHLTLMEVLLSPLNGPPIPHKNRVEMFSQVETWSASRFCMCTCLHSSLRARIWTGTWRLAGSTGLVFNSFLQENQAHTGA